MLSNLANLYANSFGNPLDFAIVALSALLFVSSHMRKQVRMLLVLLHLLLITIRMGSKLMKYYPQTKATLVKDVRLAYQNLYHRQNDTGAVTLHKEPVG